MNNYKENRENLKTSHTTVVSSSPSPLGLSAKTECLFLLPPRTTVCSISRTNFEACFLIIGLVEMKINLVFPITSPRQLRSKIKFVFDGLLVSPPYLAFQTQNPWIFEKCYAYSTTIIYVSDSRHRRSDDFSQNNCPSHTLSYDSFSSSSFSPPLSSQTIVTMSRPPSKPKKEKCTIL
jgi:hypothetical protein